MTKGTGSAFPCPKCGGDFRVIDSRPADYGIRRRRACEQCGYRITTRELIKEAVTKAMECSA